MWKMWKMWKGGGKLKGILGKLHMGRWYPVGAAD